MKLENKRKIKRVLDTLTLVGFGIGIYAFIGVICMYFFALFAMSFNLPYIADNVALMKSVGLFGPAVVIVVLIIFVKCGELMDNWFNRGEE